MTQNAFQALLQQAIGLDAIALGPTAILRAVHERMELCHIQDETAYLAHVQASAPELEALIETVVVPETWFFRDREPFVFLVQSLLAEWKPAHPYRTLRVLSMPCSTGEEPYSIAIALLEAGFAATGFRIDAIDISKNALHKAKQAIYDYHSFRGKLLTLPFGSGCLWREQYFEPIDQGERLKEQVRETVNFIQGNVLDPGLLAQQGPYDVIFCRNLLIYLDRPARHQVINTLHQLLYLNGLLFVGHAEMGQLPTAQFTPMRHFLSFAARKTNKVQPSKQRPSDGPNRKAPTSPKPRPAARLSSPAPATAHSLPSLKPALIRQAVSVDLPQASATPLDTARTLADQGQLQQAAQLCEAYIQHSPMHADAYVLLGQVYQAIGDEERAETCFQKAAYLDPNHYQALMHLVLLAEQQGNVTRAALLRQRVQRIAEL